MLRAFERSERPLGVKEIAALAGMTASQAYPSLMSLAAAPSRSAAMANTNWVPDVSAGPCGAAPACTGGTRGFASPPVR
ncbi:helix-turn-helix domain-containing protein [Salipiger sp. 1_MG-2023]|uniref:helix-turn-helix domain-containing protein n=1 Tax=Salipiger sp. 1_MG-2023 TaxID=3062665 RepID=UPI0034C68BBC